MINWYRVADSHRSIWKGSYKSKASRKLISIIILLIFRLNKTRFCKKIEIEGHAPWCLLHWRKPYRLPSPIISFNNWNKVRLLNWRRYIILETKPVNMFTIISRKKMIKWMKIFANLIKIFWTSKAICNNN